MRVVIDIPDMDLRTLARWASVSRTMKEAIRLIENNTIDDTERAIMCQEEMEQLEPVLDRLHRVVRNELWSIEAERGKKF